MDTKFEKIKNTDQRTLDIVNGYIRRKQSLLSYQQNPFYLIPPLVIHLILAYFFDGEFFANNPNGYDISTDKKTITKTKRIKGPSIYGNIIIPSTGSGIHLWTFKMLKVKTSISFGITSDIHLKAKNVQTKKFWKIKDKHIYNYAAVYSGHRGSKGMMEYKYKNFACIDDQDVVEMKLNLSKKELVFSINDKNLGPAYTKLAVGKSVKYRMSVDMMHEKSAMELMDFRQEI